MYHILCSELMSFYSFFLHEVVKKGSKDMRKKVKNPQDKCTNTPRKKKDLPV